MIKWMQQNKVFSILLILSVIAILLGIVFYAKLDIESKEVVSKNIQLLIKGKIENPITFFANQFISISLIWIFGISIVGIPIILIIYLYLLFILSFECCAIIINLKLSSIIYIGIYLLPKILMMLMMFFLCYYSIHFSIYLFKYLFMKKDFSLRTITKRYGKIYAYTFIGLIISTIIEYININYLIKIIY